MGASWADCKSKKLSFWSVILFYTTKMHHFLTGLWHEKIGLWLRRNSKALSQTCTRKRSLSLVLCCQSDPLQLSESQRNHYIWEVCSANRWDAVRMASPAASTGQQNGPNSSPQQRQPHVTQPMLQKLNTLGCKILPHPVYSPNLSPTHHLKKSSILKYLDKHLDNFLQGKCFHNQQEAENAFQELV